MDSFSEHGKTYKIEKAPALWRSPALDHLTHYYGGLHIDPGTSEEPVWSDPEQGTTTCDAIRLRISAKCYEYHGQLGLPRGKLLKETPKSGVTLLVSLDDLLTFEIGASHLHRYYTNISQNTQLLWRKAGLLLIGKAHRIITAWIDHIEHYDKDEDSKEFYLPFNYAKEKAAAAKKYPRETNALSRLHAVDLQGGVQTRIVISDCMAMLLHELGITPEIPHPDAPEWDYGTYKVTPTTLDDLEQRSVRITNPVLLKRWKERNEEDGTLWLECASQYGYGGIVGSQVAGVGRGLGNRIAKARAALEEKAQKAGR